MATTGRRARSPLAGSAALRPGPAPSPPSCGPLSPASRLRATLAGKCTSRAPAGGRLAAGRSFRSVPSPSRGLGDSRLRPPGGPPAPGPRAEPLPSPRGGAAPRRPSACQPRLPGRASPRTRPAPAALTWPPSPTGRARPETREERPPPVAGPPG